MLKSVLVVIDGSDETETVERFSIQLAKEKSASLTGIGVVDTTWITEPFPEEAFGNPFSVDSIEALARDHREVRKDLKAFGRLCAANDISAEVIEQEGGPANIIEEQSFQHDLIVMGRVLDFYHAVAPKTVRQIVRDTLRPIIMVPPQSSEKYDRVLIAYEGGIQSARALQLFLLLELGNGKKIDILTLHKNKDIANKIVQQARSMCLKHCMECSTYASEYEGNPAEYIIKYAEEIGAQMLVMGAFSHPTMRKVLFGSTTINLMEQFQGPLFIHH